MNSRTKNSAAKLAEERAPAEAATSLEFRAPEYCADGTFDETEYRFVGSTEQGWTVYRDGEEHLRLGDLLVTHRFGAAEIREAFSIARSPDCIKAVIEHETAP